MSKLNQKIFDYFSIFRDALKNFDYFALGNAFLIYYIVRFFSWPLVHFLGLPSELISVESDPLSLLVKGPTFYYIVLGFLSFLGGYQLLKLSPNFLEKFTFKKSWRSLNFNILFSLILFGVLLAKFLFFLKGVYPFGDPSPLLTNELEYYVSYFNIFGWIAVALAFIRYFSKYKKGEKYKLWQFIAWFLFIFEFSHGLFTGGRVLPLRILLIYLITRHYVLTKSWKNFISASLIVFVIIIPFWGVLGDVLQGSNKVEYNFVMKYSNPKEVARGEEPEGEVDITQGESPIKEFSEHVIDKTFGRLGQSFILSRVVTKTDKFLYGKSLEKFFISLGPPRFIWEDKPIISFDANKFGREYGIISSDDTQTRVAPTMTGDLYMNFGVWGIIVGLFVLGGIYRLIFDYFIKYSDNILSGVLVYSVIWPGLIKGAENQIAPILAGTVKLIILLIILHLFLALNFRHLLGD